MKLQNKLLALTIGSVVAITVAYLIATTIFIEKSFYEKTSKRWSDAAIGINRQMISEVDNLNTQYTIFNQNQKFAKSLKVSIEASSAQLKSINKYKVVLINLALTMKLESMTMFNHIESLEDDKVKYMYSDQ